MKYKIRDDLKHINENKLCPEKFKNTIYRYRLADEIMDLIVDAIEVENEDKKGIYEEVLECLDICRYAMQKTFESMDQ